MDRQLRLNAGELMRWRWKLIKRRKTLRKVQQSTKAVSCVNDVTDSADEDIDSKFPTNIIVSSDGTCSWIPLGLYISSCPIDITWFPFDDQNCTMKFGSWTYDGSKINLTSMYDMIDINTYQPNGEWQLLGMYAATSLSHSTDRLQPVLDLRKFR